uniref:(northern house mosquito) hypothetical protein n=1 Tax=Culex pipiens TaxID=7175 RepID=A0A8D8MIY5_CULPI
MTRRPTFKSWFRFGTSSRLFARTIKRGLLYLNVVCTNCRKVCGFKPVNCRNGSVCLLQHVWKNLRWRMICCRRRMILMRNVWQTLTWRINCGRKRLNSID